MSEGEQGDAAGHGPVTVGRRLRAAREAQGLSTADVAARTRIAQRFLEAIEVGDLAQLPSPTYASGFARAYARVVGMDQAEVGRDIRAELGSSMVAPRVHHMDEIADPARGPSRTTVIVASGLALAVLVLAVLWFATGVFRGTGAAPDVAAPSVAVAVPAARPAQAATTTGGQVILAATDEVWLRVYDAADKTLYLGTMKAGERFAVPANADAPRINVGRPDKLTVLLNGVAQPPLGDGSRAIKDVGVGAAAVRARASGAPAQAPAPTPSASVSPPAAGGSPYRLVPPPGERADAPAATPGAGASPATVP